jgi:hypothetical protein
MLSGHLSSLNSDYLKCPEYRTALDKLFAERTTWTQDVGQGKGRVVASHETFGHWPGCTVIHKFGNLYFSQYKSVHGPFTTFAEAAKAIHFFYITDAAPTAWIASEILTQFQVPSHWTAMHTVDGRTFISPMPPDADGGLPLGDEETPLQETAREIEDSLRVTRVPVICAQPPSGPQPLTATFHRSKAGATKPNK